MSFSRSVAVSLALAVVAAVGLVAWLVTRDGTEQLEAVPLTTPSDGDPVDAATDRLPSDDGQPILIISDGAILGWVDDDGWSEPDPTGTTAPEILGVVMRALDGTTKTIAGSPTVTCFPESGFGGWRLDGFEGVHASGSHDLQPRAIRTRTPLPTDEETVRDILDGLDVGAEVVIEEILVVDLEGDGKDEAIIVASNIALGEPLHGLSSDHYSVVVLRRLRADDSVEVVPIHVEKAPGEDAGANSITVQRLAAILDADADGDYEVLLRYAGYEWGGVTLHDLTTSTPTELIGAGCGV